MAEARDTVIQQARCSTGTDKPYNCLLCIANKRRSTYKSSFTNERCRQVTGEFRQFLRWLTSWISERMGKPFDHRESLIHIISWVEASDTVQNALLCAETVGLEEMKCFLSLAKKQPVKIQIHGSKSSD